MKILLLTSSYPPEVRSASHHMYELARGLADRGHTVSVVTANPGYNLAPGAEAKRNRLMQVTHEEGIRVVRVWAAAFHNVGPITRALGQFTLAATITAGSLRTGPADLVLAYSPPLTMGVAARWVGRIKGAPYIVNVQDLFPQNAIDLGVLTGRLPIRFFEAMESYVYKRAAVITAHSEGNARWLTERTRRRTRIEVVHNWVDVHAYGPTIDRRLFRTRLGLDGAFVVLFAGVMGYAQDLDTVIAAAKILLPEERIVFLLVGDGVERAKLERTARAEGVRNVRFLPFVSKEEYPALVAAADIGLVTLKKSMKTPVVPSKIMGYMAGAKPFVASLNAESDGMAIAVEGECGINVPPEDPIAMAAAIAQCCQDTAWACRLGERGRRYAATHFSKEQAVARYEALAQALGSQG